MLPLSTGRAAVDRARCLLMVNLTADRAQSGSGSMLQAGRNRDRIVNRIIIAFKGIRFWVENQTLIIEYDCLIVNNKPVVTRISHWDAASQSKRLPGMQIFSLGCFIPSAMALGCKSISTCGVYYWDAIKKLETKCNWHFTGMRHKFWGMLCPWDASGMRQK